MAAILIGPIVVFSVAKSHRPDWKVLTEEVYISEKLPE
jgi:hypothetical protein